MTSPNIPLSEQARREVQAFFLPHYQAASSAQKSLLLDTYVGITGYARTSAIRLLNHPPTNTGPIQRPRLPVYGAEAGALSHLESSSPYLRQTSRSLSAHAGRFFRASQASPTEEGLRFFPF